MRYLVLSAVLLLSTAAHAASIGAVLADPESIGAYASWSIDRALSLDARLTLSTLDAGLTAYLPITSDVHNLALSALAGYTHNPQNSHWAVLQGGHFDVLAGYAYEGAAWEVRGLAGVARYPERAGPALALMIGRVF